MAVHRRRADVHPVDQGLSVSSANPSQITQPLNAMLVPGGQTLGFAWETAGGAPTFNAFPESSPPTCSEAPGGCPPGYATLEPASNPDQVTNGGGTFAADAGGVLGVFFTDFTGGPLGCSDARTTPFGTAFVYGSGAQNASTNSYNISPGQPDSAWKLATTQADCNVDYAAVGGGPNGFGVLETNELTGTTVYHRFDAAKTSFDTPPVTIDDAHGEQQASVSQDGAGGVYATFLSGGVGGPASLAYSFDGGTTWDGPATLNANRDGAISGMTSSVDGAGQGWAVWDDSGSVVAQPFDAADSVLPAALVGRTATLSAHAVKVHVRCAVVPCTLKLAVTVRERVAIGRRSAVARVAERATRYRTISLTIASDSSVQLRRPASIAVDAPLSLKGKRYLARHRGRVKLRLTVTERIKGVSLVAERPINVTVTPPLANQLTKITSG